MPRLSELTDYDPMGNFVGAQSVADSIGVNNSTPASNNIDKILNSLFRDDEKRLQLWPEKLIRGGTTAAGRALQGNLDQWAIDPKTGDVHTSPQMIEAASEMSALAGTGGLASPGGTLNATPSLRPALKHNNRLYKGKPGQEHQDIIPDSLYNDFQKKAMSGQDLAEYNFGFVNDKGHFLSREDALKYGIDNGLIDPQAGKYGALTSTLFADSSKPGVAIESLAKSTPLIIRGKGANIGHESLETLTKPDHFYRGMSEAEYNATIGSGKNIKSNESASVPGEGTNFSHDFRDAESYANYGSTDPRKTGKPNYIVEVKGSDGFKQWRDGYFKAPEVSKDRVTRIIKMEDDGNGSIVGTIVKSDPVVLPPGYELKPVPYNPFELKS